MELRHFRYFTAVAEQGGFTKAAAMLYVSQPTLSQQIRALERELGVPLFLRAPDGVRLTAAGEVFYGHAGAVLRMVDEAARATRRAGAEPSVLRIGWSPPIPHALHVPIASAFSAAYPQVRLSWRETSLPDPERPLLDDDVDVALLRLPVDSERVLWEPISDEPCGLAVPVGHPLCELDSVDVAEVLDEPMPNVGDAVPESMKRWWLLPGSRNGEYPEAVGDPVNTVTELALSVVLNGVVCPAPYLYVKTAAVHGFRALELRGGPDSATGVARRRDDERALPRLFCELAAQVAGSAGAGLGL
ncbi:LysR family transcriptional regulator [Allokutzneria albata]|uniref:DNA-binding transcriptional regulator, LysR family n=1 Tax=Allokutzneria albata TaxID=211114 RepID=A0A1G9U0X8_ALLAB|nr:LysR family transcriptional regulator [Allokutzneria albata]SDM53473.1 DNA-binding transcriptional regulator, LysR family [Allokutzneria albata]